MEDACSWLGPVLHKETLNFLELDTADIAEIGGGGQKVAQGFNKVS